MIDGRGGKTYLLDMNAKTILSAKGEVAIPQDVRDQLGLVPGQMLDVIATSGGIFIRPAFPKSGRSFDEIMASIQSNVTYDGPVISIEAMNETIAQGWRQSALKSDF